MSSFHEVSEALYRAFRERGYTTFDQTSELLDIVKANFCKVFNAQSTEIERLRKALRPFAAMAAHYPTDTKYGNRPRSGTVHAVATHGIGEDEITVEDFRAARAALE